MGVPVTVSMGKMAAFAVLLVAAGEVVPPVIDDVAEEEGTLVMASFPCRGFTSRAGGPDVGPQPAVGVAEVTDGPSPPPY